MTAQRPWTGNDRQHNDLCHTRWLTRLNRTTGNDYGACTNALSAFDGQVRFEHDGCAAFSEREDHSFG